MKKHKSNIETKNAKVKTGINVISVVVPKVNGDWAKLIVLNEKEYKAIKQASDSNKSVKNKELYSLMCDATGGHNLLETGHLMLTKSQFDDLLKEKYNEKYQLGHGGKPLRDVA